MFDGEVSAEGLSEVLASLMKEGYQTPSISMSRGRLTEPVGHVQSVIATHYLVVAFKSPLQEAREAAVILSDDLKAGAQSLVGAAAEAARGLADRLDSFGKKG
jgi:hypothetical protein